MSSAEGNDEYRNADEVARRVYIQEIQKLINDTEDDEEKQRFISLISKLGDPQVRIELDKDLSVSGVDINEVHQRIQNKIEAMGKVSYRDYLQQENRWSGGMSELSGYWVLQAAKVNVDRFRKMLEDPNNNDAINYIIELGFKDPREMSEDEFEEMKQTNIIR